MIVREMNAGEKIPFRLGRRYLYLGENDEVQINLAGRQQDIEVAVDVYLDDAGGLREGAGKYYVANVIIPPRRYGLVEKTMTDMDGNTYIATAPEPVPLDMDTVTLQLWAVPPKNINTGGM